MQEPSRQNNNLFQVIYICASKMDYKTEFPHIFAKELCIKVKKLNFDKVQQKTPARITRSSKKNCNELQWVRVKNGKYKGDIARVLLIDEKKSEVHVHLFPRIDFGLGKRSRRQPIKLFDPEAIRNAGGQVAFYDNCWIWNECQFSLNGLLKKTFQISDVEYEGLFITLAEMKRFESAEESLTSTTNLQLMRTNQQKRKEEREHITKRSNSAEEPLAPTSNPNKSPFNEQEQELHASKRFKATDSVQPSKRKRKQTTAKTSQLSMILPPDLSKYAICWVKMKGFRDWPGVIEDSNNGYYSIHFFGDYTTAKVHKNKLTNFYEGFSMFHHTFDSPKLYKAVQEASICLMGTANPSYCFVCSILNSRKNRAINN
ncbi:uncharacterized protein LOC129572569 [Sitodiplosis mosellana]|uniref:uncharacterized protein LOC129572569 n=1 Tax=Sitodiplosis mosellana TaxID=263140 RepID=UPI00244423A0|nr:uncharacterized protein LOC129572569 [Sitodiplosis mosellana]